MESLTINISLPVSGVQLVLRALGKQPYDDVNAVIQHIVNATNEQIEASRDGGGKTEAKGPPPELVDPFDPRS